jgi:hypothetical protein
MSIIDRIKARLGFAIEFKRNALDEVELLIHKEARHHAPHGIMVATNRARNIKLAAVPFVFPDLVEAPKLTQRVVTDIWEGFYSQGWVPDHIVAYGDLQPLVKPEEEQGTDASDAFASAGFPSGDTAAMRLTQDLGIVPRSLRVPAVQRQGMHLVTPEEPGQLKLRTRTMAGSYSPQVKSLLARYHARVAKLEPNDLREQAYVRFEGIVNTGTQMNHSLEQMTDKLELALREIASEDFFTLHLGENVEPAAFQQ